MNTETWHLELMGKPEHVSSQFELYLMDFLQYYFYIFHHILKNGMHTCVTHAYHYGWVS